MSDLKAVFGSNVKRLREKGGFSQKDFAAKLEMSPSYLSQIEAGLKGFSHESLTDISVTLGCEPAELLVGPSASAGSAPPKSFVRKTIDAIAQDIALGFTRRERDTLHAIVHYELSEFRDSIQSPRQTSELELAFRNANDLRREGALAILTGDDSRLAELVREIVASKQAAK